MSKLDFLVIGTMKSGTTTLADQLRSHNGIYIPERKELEYFSRDNNFAKGAGWYEEQFSGAGLYDSFSGCLADDLDDDTFGPSHCDETKAGERGAMRALRK